ncbi:MAG: DUF4166 domain-containing protein [Rhizobiaceae bacterium]|nr:DUF4166 domain-containing protein [Rhizobiaceae bacterium]
MKILVLGGYGVFGGRLIELLSDLDALEIYVCGRSFDKADAYCSSYKGQSQVKPYRLDRIEIASALDDIKPDLVVDASGPFQNYGKNPHTVIEACIDAGIDYMDFADGADFVFEVARFNDKARDKNVFVLSGVSSFPVLTTAVLKVIAADMELTGVKAGIAPSPYAGIGLNVMRAVVGYAGSPVKLLRDGKHTQAPGLAETMRYTISPPGRMPLRNILFSLVDVPDLQVLPKENATLRDIWMGAGPVPEFLHRSLILLAKTRNWLNLPNLAPLSPLFYKVLNLMKFGEHRGGMFVEATGERDGKQVTKSWHLLAESDDGPYIPSMAVEAIVRKMLNGQRPKSGARPATDVLTLEDYNTLFEKRTIYTGFRDDSDSSKCLYRNVLGSAFEELPPAVQKLHDGTSERTWSGHAEVRRGNGLLANLIARLFSFPKQANRVPVSVEFAPDQKGERWTRTFADTKFRSYQFPGKGKNEHLLVERFGLIDVALALVLNEDRLTLIPRRWSVFGIPLPKFLLPKGNSFEKEQDGKFHFDVEMVAPIVGLIVGYRGDLMAD